MREEIPSFRSISVEPGSLQPAVRREPGPLLPAVRRIDGRGTADSSPLIGARRVCIALGGSRPVFETDRLSEESRCLRLGRHAGSGVRSILAQIAAVTEGRP